MTTWIRLDPLELARAAVQLRDVGLALGAGATRVRSACCAPGLGRHGNALMGEGEALSQRILAMAESYVLQAVDILQRVVVAINDGALVSSVGTVGTAGTVGTVGAFGGSPLVGGFVLGTTTPMEQPVSTGWGNPGFLLGTSTPSAPVPSSWWGTGSAPPAGFVLDVTGARVGGGYLLGTGGAGGGTMALAGLAQSAQDRAAARLAALQASGASSGSATTAAMQNAAAVTRQQMSQLNATSGLGNPWTGYSQAGLTRFEHQFGVGFMGKSVKERFGS